MQDAFASMRKILVVVPDRELRRSIEFALEAEGLAFESHADLASALRARVPDGAVCAIIDEDAVAGRNGAGAGLEGFAESVVLLVDRLRAAPRAAGVTVLTKPLLGRRLIDTVAVAMVHGPAAPPAT